MRNTKNSQIYRVKKHIGRGHGPGGGWVGGRDGKLVFNGDRVSV